MRLRLMVFIVLFFGLFSAAGADDNGMTFISSSLGSYRIPGTNGDVQLYRNIGKPTLVVFWASWCYPCLSEIPEINRLQKTYHGTDLVILGMNLDENVSESKLQMMAKKFGIEYPVAIPTAELIRDFGIEAIPAVFLFGTNGRLECSWLGATGSDELEKCIGKFVIKKNAAQ